MTPGGLITLLDAAQCGAYAVSVDQTIVAWNRNAERILGFTPQEVLGRRCYEVVSGVKPSSVTPECEDGCPLLRYLRAGLVPTPVRLRMLCSSGERKSVRVTPMVITGILRDAPLLVHLFDDSPEPAESDLVQESLRAALAAGGADVLSDHPPAPGPADEGVLTRRELEILRLMAVGWETARIAGELGISRHTVRNHIRNLRQKLGAPTKLDAVVTGIRLGILPVD